MAPPAVVGVFFDIRTALHQANYCHIESPNRVLSMWSTVTNYEPAVLCLDPDGSSLYTTEQLCAWLVSSGDCDTIRNLYINSLQLHADVDTTAAAAATVQDHPPQFLLTLQPSNLPSAKVCVDLDIPLNSLWSSVVLPVLKRIHSTQLIVALCAQFFATFPDSEVDSETEDDRTVYPGTCMVQHSQDTFINRYTYISVFYSLRGIVYTLHALMVQRIINVGIMLIRPPGHHTSRSVVDGCCLFNTVSFTAQLALHIYPH
uniref:Histone deacetylase domain-containing protein n=2 Tax=Lygus hesperus TaxID=30085 RepID=A0A146KR87_LYGHE